MHETVPSASPKYAYVARPTKRPQEMTPGIALIAASSPSGSLMSPKATSRTKHPLSVTTGPILPLVAMRSFASPPMSANRRWTQTYAIGSTSTGTPDFHTEPRTPDFLR
eukprot:Amastigsp_a677381_62.p3 type:complete len:109 gc:universal Amastigsp_a677381_62:733-407(-)